MIKSQAIAQIQGRVSSIKELKYANEQAYLQFGLAVDQSKRKEDGTYTDDKPLFFDCVAFGSKAEQINRYVSEYRDATGSIGMTVSVEGMITVDVKPNGEGKNQKFFSIKVFDVLVANVPKKTGGGQLVTGAVIKPCAEAVISGRISSSKGYNQSKKFLQFGIAVDRAKRNEDGSYTELDPYYFDMVAFGKMGERIDKYIKKYKDVLGTIGMEIVVKTSISPDSFERNGTKIRRLSFKVTDLEYANVPKKDGSGSSMSSQTTTPIPVASNPAANVSEEEDDLPFD